MPPAVTVSSRALFLSFWALAVPGSFQQIEGKKLKQNVSFLSSRIFNELRLKDEKLLFSSVGDQTWGLARAK